MHSYTHKLTRLIAPIWEPIGLAEAKLFLRVDQAEYDTLISDMIVVARQTAEQFLRQSLITQSWKLTVDDDCRSLTDMRYELPMGPVQSISSVVAMAVDGSTQNIDNEYYTLSTTRDVLVFKDMVTSKSLEISYVAGFGDAAAIARPIKQAMLMHIAAMFDHNDLENTYLPDQSLALYQQYRKILL